MAALSLAHTAVTFACLMATPFACCYSCVLRLPIQLRPSLASTAAPFRSALRLRLLLAFMAALSLAHTAATFACLMAATCACLDGCILRLPNGCASRLPIPLRILIDFMAALSLAIMVVIITCLYGCVHWFLQVCSDLTVWIGVYDREVVWI